MGEDPNGEVEATMKATKRVTFAGLWMFLLSLFGLVLVGLWRCATEPHVAPATNQVRCLEWVQTQYEECVTKARQVMVGDHEYRLLQLCEDSMPMHRAECQAIMGSTTSTASGGTSG